MRKRIQAAFEKVKQDLLNRRTADGHWVGRLSSSALSTATAVSALSIAQKETPQKNGSTFRYDLSQSVEYLLKTQNADGGWGDTDKSFSNISTTLLVKSALVLSGTAANQSSIEQATKYIEQNGGINALRKRYGKDQTFSVPILTNAALAGLVDWHDVPQLPFERAAMPQAMFRLLNLQVVSYAIPALVAIGQVRFHHQKQGLNPLAMLRRWAIKPTLKLIEQMQPLSGGYLEAAPLTSFVAMSLCRCGLTEHPVVQNCLRFLRDTKRDDGSWAIDTNLATWVTTLSVNALGNEAFSAEEAEQLADWILSCQHTEKHPFTGALPGGWGWTNLSGAVPDADDTPGAILALEELAKNIQNEERRQQIVQATDAGRRWLKGLQNRDGGIPTFCRGWGVLPFDKSSTDLTAHTIRACLPSFDWKGAMRFIEQSQQRDGSWLPLWFGNQHQLDDINPFYGTAKVLLALNQENVRQRYKGQSELILGGLNFLLTSQNADGSWGSSIEETAVVLEALSIGERGAERSETLRQKAQRKGFEFLCTSVESGSYQEPSPIGLYFAKLWYYEELYPLIFTAAALRRYIKADET